MFKIDKELRKNGEVDFDVSTSPFESITVQFGGDLGGGSIQLFSTIFGVRVPVADGGPFNEIQDKDDYELPIRRVVILGRADVLSVVVTGAVSPDLKIGVR